MGGKKISGGRHGLFGSCGYDLIDINNKGKSATYTYLHVALAFFNPVNSSFF